MPVDDETRDEIKESSGIVETLYSYKARLTKTMHSKSELLPLLLRLGGILFFIVQPFIIDYDVLSEYFCA